MTLRPILILLLSARAATAQRDLFDLVTTGDGSTAYFATVLAHRGSSESAGLARIYRIDSGGIQLYIERPRIDPPETGPGLMRFTNYFSLSNPQASRDGGVVAVVGRRQCFGASACASVTTLQTTVTGLPGGPVDYVGAGRLSGNGSYLLIYGDGSLGGRSAYAIDLRNGQELRPQSRVSASAGLGGGRVIADDGTFVLAGASLYLGRGTEVTEVRVGAGSPGEAVIDSAASVVAYSFGDWYTSRRSIRIYHVAEQSDSPLGVLPEADSHAPYLSADGRRVMFLSNASGPPQIYTANIDGSGLRQVSRNATGVLSAAMSDDGNVAWYFSGAARLHRLDLDTGEDQERLGRTPQLGYTARMAAGSLYSVPGVGLSDAVFTAQAFPLPHTLGGVSVALNGADCPLISVAPTQILLQVPWQTGMEANLEVKTDSSSPFEPQLRFATTALPAYPTFLTQPDSPSAYGGYDVLAIHQNWDALVTAKNPARPNEILHLYGAGFGAVDAPPPDGMPAPSGPPARTAVPVTCWAWGADNATRLDIPVYYSGLAPALVGVYQLDIRVPGDNLRPSVQISCTGEGDRHDFYGSFAAMP